MSYLALYRKYRPRNFDEVIGQDETTEILKNQIHQRKFGHAYLFSGIRGTGKTSTAKIMAKAVNCLSPVNGNPCDQCENCLSINRDQFMDVIEIDAASNNGVDNVRELRENAKYLPSKGTHKVYIIDEVQMLSTGAFNALLKTLEEPSEHVVFILATTEPEKIPVTILSRCQRYDFKRLALNHLVHAMEKILGDLGLTYDDEALEMIAVKSDGAMRDALSLLEKVVSKAQGHIGRELTSDVLGVVAFIVLHDLFEAVSRQDMETAIRLIGKLVDSGISVSHILEQMLGFIRAMLLSKVFQTPSEIVALPTSLQEQLIRDFSEISLSQYSDMIEKVNEALSKLRYAANPRLSLELTVVSMSLLFGAQPQPAAQPAVQTVEEPVVSAPEPTPAAPEPVVQPQPQPKAQPQSEIGLLDQWEQVLDMVKNERKIAHAFLIEGTPDAVEGSTVILRFRPEYSFHMENVMLPENRKIIENVMLGLTGKRYEIEAVMGGIAKKEPPKEVSDVDKVKEFLGDEYKDILTIK